MEDKNTNITLDSPAEATSNSFERKKKKRKAHRLSDRTRNNE